MPFGAGYIGLLLCLLIPTTDDSLDVQATTYLQMLERADSTLTPDEMRLLDRHVRQAAPILPDPLRSEIENASTEALPHLSRRVARWWRSRDPLPATSINERVIEHLQRVAYAETHFAWSGSPTGYDDRGEIYIRFGEPALIRTLSLDRVTDDLFQPGVHINLNDITEGEFWFYQRVDRAAHYLFVHRNGRYRISEIRDLIPSTLRYGLHANRRGNQKSEMLIRTLQAIYEQLAPLHDDFAPLYLELDDYVKDLDLADREAQKSRAFAQQNEERSDGDNAASRAAQQAAEESRQTLLAQLDPPHIFANHMLSDSRLTDAEIRADRYKFVPTRRSEVLDGLNRLPLAVRTARFLEPDGTTRTEIYWLPLPGALTPDAPQQLELRRQGYEHLDRFLINLTARQRTADFTTRQLSVKRYLLTDIAPDEPSTIPVQTLSVKGDTGLYHLGFQWDQYLVETDDPTRPKPGPQVRTGLFHSDSLLALDANQRRLEMSDLVPLFVSNVEQAVSSGGAEGASPYPFDRVTGATPLGLAFELYHLTYDLDDQTRYTVEYEIEREAKRRFLRRRRTGNRISVKTNYTGTERTSGEFILLDLSEVAGSGPFGIRVRVTDTLTGQMTERAIGFDLIEG